jgi:hypothetical protein
MSATNPTKWHLVLNQSLRRVREQSCVVSYFFWESVTSYTVHCIFAHPSVNRHSYWTATLLMKGPMCCPETPVTNYQATPLNIPEELRSLPSLLSLGKTGTTLMFRPCRARIHIFLRTQEQRHQEINGRWANLVPYCNMAGPDWNVACFLQR